MDSSLSSSALSTFFASAPFALGALILLATFLAKRHETVSNVPIGQTFACANCGRRGVREHMVPQVHDGAVSWHCTHCSGARR